MRDRLLAAVGAGETVSAVARRFAVGRSTVQDWVRALRQDGRREAGRMGGHRKPAMGVSKTWGNLLASLGLISLAGA